MQNVSEKELLEMQGGAAHYHWICRKGINYTSKTTYKSNAAAGKAADKHIENYPLHASKVSTLYCEKRH